MWTIAFHDTRLLNWKSPLQCLPYCCSLYPSSLSNGIGCITSGNGGVTIDEPDLNQTHGTSLGTDDILDLQLPGRLGRQQHLPILLLRHLPFLPICTFLTLTLSFSINNDIGNQLGPLGGVPLPGIRQQHHLQVLRAHHALDGARYDADGRRDLVHDHNATGGGHAGDDAAQDPETIRIRVVVHDHAQEVDGGVFHRLRRVEIVFLEGEAGTQVGRDDAGGRVGGAGDDVGQVLHDDAHRGVCARDRDRAVPDVAGDVDDDAVLGQRVPREPAPRVLLGHHRERAHVRHQLREPLPHPRLAGALVVRVHGQIGAAREIQPGFVRVNAAVPEVLQRFDLLDRHREHVARDVCVESCDARVCDEEFRGRGVGDFVGGRFVEDVDLD